MFIYQEKPSTQIWNSTFAVNSIFAFVLHAY